MKTIRLIQGFPTRRSVACAFVTIAALCTVSASSAEEDAEREQLARLSYEFAQLQSMIDKAAQTAENKGRARFRYDLLRRDVQLVQRGIDDHLSAPRQPRPVPALKGDYRD